MEEKLYLNDFESGKSNFKNITSTDGTIDHLVSKVLKLEETIELLKSELKVVSNLKKELIKINSEKTEVKNKLYANEELVSVPIGTIVAFAGKEIPEGWKLCDGTNGPNLDDKVIFGTTNKTRNKEVEAGFKNIVLNEAHLPAHVHVYDRITYSFFNKQAVISSGTFSDSRADFYYDNRENLSKSSTSPAGRGSSINITPPNVKMLYMIKTV